MISLKHIYLIRHCKATGQESTAELTSEGQIQANHLAEFLVNRQIDYLVSSPFERAISTIRPLAEQLNLKIHVDERLQERVLSTDHIEDWMERLRESFENMDQILHGGESSRESMIRGVSVIEDLFERPEENMAVVTHGNLLSLILKFYDNSYGFKEWERLTNPDVYELFKNSKEEQPSLKRILFKPEGGC